MFNFNQANRLSHLDHKLLELMPGDFEELYFNEYQNRNGNRVFTRFHKKSKTSFKLKMLSCFKYSIFINGELQMVSNHPLIIKRWNELVSIWFEKTNDCIFYS